MALARCEGCGRPKGTKNNYVGKHLPTGHPNSGVICGSSNCGNAAVVWLTEVEEREYKNGARIFGIPNAAAKLRVQ